MASTFITGNFVGKALHLIMNLLLLSSVLSNCNFPDFINPQDVWTMKNEEGGTLTAYIKSYVIDAKYCQYPGSECERYVRRCFENRGDNKYVVKHERSNTRSSEYSHPKYLCLQFVYRSDTVLQIKSSVEFESSTENICDNLELNNWLLISLTAFGRARPIDCPFSGGYNLEISSLNTGVLCSNKILSPRIESECEPGDGITFDFKHPDCIHDSLKSIKMKLVQHVDCVATWSMRNYQFVVLRPDADSSALCLRIKKPLDNIRHAYLFMDLVCDPGNSLGQPQDTKNYLSITFDRKRIHSVCENEFEGCRDERVCQTDMQNHCMRACGQCQSDTACVFPEYLRRAWGIFDKKRKQTGVLQYVNITNYEIDFPDVGRFQCLFNNVTSKHRSVLLHTFENGCYPKFTCMETYYSSDTVRQFRLGTRINWPLFPLSKVKDQACRSNMFRQAFRIGDSKEYLDAPKITVVDPTYIKSVNCKLGYEFRNHARGLYFRERDQCDGCVYHNSKINPQHFNIQTMTCPSSETYLEYICLASYKFDNETSAVITGTRVKARGEVKQFLCWIFTGEGDKRKIVVLDASDCNEIKFKQAMVGDIKPRSMFDVLEKPPKQCPISYPDPMPDYEHIEVPTRPPPVYPVKPQPNMTITTKFVNDQSQSPASQNQEGGDSNIATASFAQSWFLSLLVLLVFFVMAQYA